MTRPCGQDLDLGPALPLLRAVQREIDERRARPGVIERWPETFSASRRARAADVALLESERSTHQRALREVARELARPGLDFDAEGRQRHPLRTGSGE